MNMIKCIFASSIGKKYVMAVTGLMLFGFVCVHLLGNLQIFLGADHINTYAALLQGNKAVLWSFRAVMLVLVLTHITMALTLTLENRAARPISYASGKVPHASFAARTMVFGGIALFAFIGIHLLHFTVGVVTPDIMHHMDLKGRHDVYQMMIEGFNYKWVSLIYIVGMVALFLHLSHGVESFFQTLGLKNRVYGCAITVFAKGAAAVILFGNCAIVLAALTGVLH
jgi:succinate dehydrogenase / fumarate reductase cytochrome b subunit